MISDEQVHSVNSNRNSVSDSESERCSQVSILSVTAANPAINNYLFCEILDIISWNNAKSFKKNNIGFLFDLIVTCSDVASGETFYIRTASRQNSTTLFSKENVLWLGSFVRLMQPYLSPRQLRLKTVASDSPMIVLHREQPSVVRNYLFPTHSWRFPLGITYFSFRTSSIRIHQAYIFKSCKSSLCSGSHLVHNTERCAAMSDDLDLVSITCFLTVPGNRLENCIFRSVHLGLQVATQEFLCKRNHSIADLLLFRGKLKEYVGLINASPSQWYISGYQSRVGGRSTSGYTKIVNVFPCDLSAVGSFIKIDRNDG